MKHIHLKGNYKKEFAFQRNQSSPGTNPKSAWSILAALLQSRLTECECHVRAASCRNEHGSGLDRTGSGLKPIFAGQDLIGLHFFENWRLRTGSDWKKFCWFNVIILKISKY